MLITSHKNKINLSKKEPLNINIIKRILAPRRWRDIRTAKLTYSLSGSNAGAEGIEPPTVVLETTIMPLN